MGSVLNIQDILSNLVHFEISSVAKGEKELKRKGGLKALQRAFIFCARVMVRAKKQE